MTVCWLGLEERCHGMVLKQGSVTKMGMSVGEDESLQERFNVQASF